MGGQSVVWPAQLTHVASLKTLLCIILSLDAVTLSVTPSVARGAGHYQLPVLVSLLTQRTLLEALTGATRAVVIKPATETKKNNYSSVNKVDIFSKSV